MAENKGKGKSVKPRLRLDNSMMELATGVRLASLMTTPLSGYGTIAASNNYALMTLNRIILTYLYTGNGIFQSAVDLPIQDALSRNIEIISDQLSEDDIAEVLAYMEDKGLWDRLSAAWAWVRCYGGGALVINTSDDPSEPLSLRHIHNEPLEVYDVDRWQLDASTTPLDLYRADIRDAEYLYLNGMRIHSSRCIIGTGKRAPAIIRMQLRGWGMSEGERMIRDLNNYLKTQNVLYEILDESKVDVYSIKGLANRLINEAGTKAVLNRIQYANQIKNYVNALVLDTEEQFEQKSMTFTGLAEVMNENRIGIAAALRMPMTKLFGLSPAGFSNGESDLETYNMMVESEVRAKMRPMIRRLLEVVMAHMFGFVPDFSFKFPSLRETEPFRQAEIDEKNTNMVNSLYDRGILTPSEAAQMLKKKGIVTIDMVAETSDTVRPPAGVDEEYQTAQSVQVFRNAEGMR